MDRYVLFKSSSGPGSTNFIVPNRMIVAITRRRICATSMNVKQGWCARRNAKTSRLDTGAVAMMASSHLMVEGYARILTNVRRPGIALSFVETPTGRMFATVRKDTNSMGRLVELRVR